MAKTSTTYLDRHIIAPNETIVLAELWPGRVARIQLDQITPGMRTLNRTTYIESQGSGSSLEEILDGLKSIPLYQAVVKQLFPGEDINYPCSPLRYGLITGYANEIGVAPDEAVEIAFRTNGRELTKEQEFIIAREAHGDLERKFSGSQTHVVQLDTIRYGWLSGDTISPQDWTLLEGLSHRCEFLRPYSSSYQRFPDSRPKIRSARSEEQFYDALDLDKREPNKYGSYLFYCALRRTAAQKVGRKEHKLRPSEDGESAVQLLHLGEMLERIKDYYSDRLTDEVSLETVIRTRVLPDDTPQKKKPQPSIFHQGFYRGELPMGVEEYGISHLIEDYNILYFAFASFLCDSIQILVRSFIAEQVRIGTIPPNSYGEDSINGITPYIIHEYFLTRDLLPSSQADLFKDCFEEDVRRHFSREAQDLILSFVQSLIDEDNFSVIDQNASLPDGTYLKLRRIAGRIVPFIPGEYSEVSLLNNFLDISAGDLARSRRREIQREIEKKEVQLLKRYDFDISCSRRLFDVTYRGLRRLSSNIDKPFMRSLVGGRSWDDFTRDTIERIPMMTYRDIEHTLDRYDLGPLIKYFDANLYRRFHLL